MKKYLIIFLFSFGFVFALKAQNKTADSSTVDRIFTYEEQSPQFKSGVSGISNFIGQNLIYPDSAISEDIQGTVHVRFIVNEKGKVLDAKVIKGIGYGCDEEALRVVKLLPDFIPGKQNGVPIKTYFTLPITFKLADE